MLKLKIMNAHAEALKPIVSAILQGRGGFSSEILSTSIFTQTIYLPVSLFS